MLFRFISDASVLYLGKLLELANIDYIIFERDKSATSAIVQSETLDVHVGAGQLALKEAGLLDQFNSLARGNVTVVFADSTGKVHKKFGEGDQDIERPKIDRRDLRALLIGSIPGHRIRGQRGADGSISIYFATGRVESGFRLVVGADGAWSKARSLVSQNIVKAYRFVISNSDKVTSAKPQYSGLYYLTCSIKPENSFHSSATSLVGQGNYLSLGNGKQIGAQKLGEGSYYIAIDLRLPESWSSENAALLKDPAAPKRSLLDDFFFDWAQINTDLIKHADGDFRAWPLYAVPTESLSWQTVAGVTLLGDAAHVTTPFIGEGVNCAMYDSIQLAQQMIKYGIENLDCAVSEYEKLMFPRAINLIEQSARSGELLYAPDAPRGWLDSFAGIYNA
ncbi:FAD/NAD(P)-binding domain-containing protein [Polychaeton citri CBS 116435]|uniref:FAD/NAD(P)-binding domain-containing protein n=1 Tax=Polychaeton citri CBS 116435 TaxID=1314669 RepID=A0A9P4UT80_9PEZI|nr:FAD/NAD(P)-binding domain-containing protein [Polychaeton citri CBS 116435]